MVTPVGARALIAGTPKKSAAEEAYQRIRALVVDGVLRPGQVVSEQDISDLLDIGRTPVREALQRLAAQHVLTIFPRRGIAVAKLGLTDVQAVFEARAAVEAELAALAARRRTDDAANAIHELNERIHEAAETGDFAAFLKLDQELHHAIADSARSRFLAEDADHLLLLSNWIWHQHFLLHGSHPTAYFSHDRILEAIRQRNVDTARQAMRAHVDHAHAVIRGVM